MLWALYGMCWAQEKQHSSNGMAPCVKADLRSLSPQKTAA